MDNGSVAAAHPLASMLRLDRFPHIWCPGCGIGIVVRAFADAIGKAGLDRDKVCVVSGIGCSGRVAGYMNLDSFHSTHGRAIPFATGVKLARPDLKVVVVSGDGDLAAIGGNHLIHAARRNIDLTVICINNLNYGMTGGQAGPTTPEGAVATTAPYGAYETPFSLPKLVAACGAMYVARYTILDPLRLTEAITTALQRKGFSFVEAIAPCTELYARRNKLGDGLELTKYYAESAELHHGASGHELDIEFQSKFVVGHFVDETRPDYITKRDTALQKTLGDKYVVPGNGGGNGYHAQD